MKIFTLSLFVAFIPLAQADWAEDWFDSAITSGSEHYQSQKRGFYSIGSYQARMNTSRDYLLSVNLPRIRSGCGGIDHLCSKRARFRFASHARRSLAAG